MIASHWRSFELSFMQPYSSIVDQDQSSQGQSQLSYLLSRPLDCPKLRLAIMVALAASVLMAMLDRYASTHE